MEPGLTAWVHATCDHPEHDPPGLTDSPGSYLYVCPGCGNMQAFTVLEYDANIPMEDLPSRGRFYPEGTEVRLRGGKEKSRSVKTFQEKYGLASVEDEFNVRWSDQTQEHFDELPYLGIFYVDWDDPGVNHLVYYTETPDIDTEEKSMVKAKVIKVTMNGCMFAHYDNHHHQICVDTFNTAGFVLVGNEIRKNDLENDR